MASGSCSRIRFASGPASWCGWISLSPYPHLGTSWWSTIASLISVARRVAAATASEGDAEKGEFKRAASSYWFTYSDWRAYGYSRWSFYHQELRHHAARFYSEYLPAGNYHLSYVAQAIAPGEFHIGPLHSEEMYDPDVFGQGVPAKLIVEEAQ